SGAAVSTHGWIFEREPAGRGCRIFLGATEGIRLSPHSCSKGALSERHRIVARAELILCLVAAPHWLRQGNDIHFGTTHATKGRTGLRRQLDWGYRPSRTSPPV